MNTYTKLWFLEDFILFNNLGKMMMIRMAKVLDMFTINKGQTINLSKEEKKHVFFLKSGTVKIIDTQTSKVKYIVNKGSIFGELALFDADAPMQEQVIALDDCILCSMEVDKMLTTMKKYPFLKNNILKAYGNRIKKLEKKIQDLSSENSTTRIYNFLTEHISEFGKQEGSSIISKNLLSHKDIANLTNTSRQTVSNVMSCLRKEGVIDYDNQTISLHKHTLNKQIIN
ncbi:CRP/FNR family transcriptional regulator, anaerobic regulatory protein [Aquimarina amphilecti]|uniref:CRP/FNR family transcriptional regulator, anaerobic regulatory protein n=1 Tax=Aquimarina amphilecti TaxID=1038014 RepID=A0A1H7SGT1_AQUAM|nr:Crp/Fnr family transcriptional regulator [Aquimarina amphilecti]SEL71569.1 CRP/FNR family transcriptional regulator, anaerobic regulatory protein [Aquimarina amphilecti]